MISYTEKEIKEWFEIVKGKYPNSVTKEHLEAVEFIMFNEFCEKDNLKKVLDKSE